ncbi:SWIM zinc finger family protein [Methanocaldococcus sp.]
MEEIIQKYGYIIYNRGVEYYKNKRVQQVLKFKNKLYGKVIGNFVYDVIVDLKSLESRCSCPYGHNCKHGVATILGYMNNEYVDVDKIVDGLKKVDKEKLFNFILEKIGRNPEFALNFVGLLDDVSELSYIYKQVKNKLLTYIAIMKSGTYIDKNTAKEIGNFLLENKNFLSK